MSKEKNASASPFSALTYQEQQDRWLEWRSRQLNYKDAKDMEEPLEKDEFKPYRQEQAPLLRQPNMPIASHARHGELDLVLSRHRRAVQRAGTFQSTRKPD